MNAVQVEQTSYEMPRAKGSPSLLICAAPYLIPLPSGTRHRTVVSLLGSPSMNDGLRQGSAF